MTKPKKLTSIKKTPRSPQTDVYVMEPSAISQATGKVTGTPTQPIYQAVPKAKNNNNSWQNLNDLSSEIGQWIASLSEEINSSVEMVKLFGCDHPAEFNAVVTKSNEDINRFISDYFKIQSRHKHLTGSFQTPDDTALALSIFEDYTQFRAYFEGVIHHTLISFTEFALEAQDRMKAQAAAPEEQAALTTAPTESK